MYHALQAPEDIATPEVIDELNQVAKRLQDEHEELKSKEKKARIDLATLNAKLSLPQIRNSIDRLENAKKDILERLTKLRESCNSIQVVSQDERMQVEGDWKFWQYQVTTRRRICRELWARCSEVLPEDMTSEDLWVRAFSLLFHTPFFFFFIFSMHS